MSKFLCILLVVILCGCTHHQQSNTFKEKYDIYAEPKPDFSNWVIAIPGASPYPAMAYEQCGLPISMLEDFIDAIVRRMDAKNLTEYDAAQDRLDTIFNQLHNMLKMEEGHKTLYTWPEGYAYRHLLGDYMIRDEAALKTAYATIQYMKYQLSQ
ncbi:hypothetical protein J5I95_17385 [Candidatus Poribacteria bacterium]|nr:hypothetical protein [Candidatus Poribacteria bacterium]